MKIKKIILAFRTVLKKSRIAGTFYNMFCKYLPIHKGAVFLESHNGKELMGNPYYITRYLLETLQYAGLQLAVSGGSSAKKVLKKLNNGHLVKICRQHSLYYCYYLATSEFLVSDNTFPPYFSRRQAQKYLNTWHGTPLKTLGRKFINSPFELSNAQRNFFHMTHLLVPNPHTEKALLEDYMIKKIWNGSVLRGGYPRNSIFFKAIKRSSYSPSLDYYNVAFMPTWRGTLENIKISSIIQLQQLQQLFSYLEQNLPDLINIWVRLHPLVHQHIDLKSYKKIKPFPNTMEPYEFLSQCDALVTDYSSVMFDYAITHKPIILYATDEKEYLDERSFCLDFSSLPFPKIESKTQLLETLIKLSKDNFTHLDYKIFINQFCPYENEKSTADLCRHFFDGDKVLEEYTNSPDRKKKSVLLFVGSFFNNGITTSLKNLLEHLDKDRYNIYLWINRFDGEIRAKDYFQKLDHKISYIPSQNWLSVDIIDGLRFLWRDLFYKDFSENDIFMRTLWSHEYQRLFGSVNWDTIIHFTGYERRITFIMLAATQAKKIVFMHNDMFLEIKTGRVNDPRSLELAYNISDSIAIVRRGAESAYNSNLMNIEKKTYFVPNTISKKCMDMAKADVLEALNSSLREIYNDTILEALKKTDHFRFINLARFSAEKGQLRLIEAFEKVWKNRPNCQLFIIGGHGDKYEDILQRSHTSPAAKAIFVLLGSSNPFPLLARMNAFVFSSFYEGIGLVIYESFALGIPVISTDIPGPSELLNQGYGLVVENSVDGLVQGMIQALEGKIPTRPYDFETHNQEALQRFYALID